MSTRAEVLWGIVAVVMIALFTSSVFDASSAERRAIRWETEAGMRLQARRGVEANYAVLDVEYQKVVSENVVLRELVDDTNEEMSVVQLEAGQRIDSLVARVEEVAGDSVATIAWADSLVTAHGEETYSLEVRLSAALTYIEHDDEQHIKDAALDFLHAQADELLHMQIVALENASGSWQDAYRAGWLSRIADNPKLVVVSVAAGIGLCVAFCPEDPQVAGAYLMR